jgi:hypothetical protein
VLYVLGLSGIGPNAILFRSRGLPRFLPLSPASLVGSNNMNPIKQKQKQHLPRSANYIRLARKLATDKLVDWIKRDVRMVLQSAKQR